MIEHYIVLPDLHFPFLDPKYLKIVEKLIKDIRPAGIVQLGDFVDWFQISSFDKDPSRLNTAYEDLELYRELLDRWEKLLPPGSVFHQIEGNHEDRLRRYIWQRAPQIAKMIRSITEMLQFPERNRRGRVKFKWHDLSNWQSCKIGDVYLFHGFYYNQHVAMTLLNKYHANVVAGHTHRVQYVTNGRHFACSLGHGSDEGQTAHSPVPTGWEQAIGLLNVCDGKGSLEIYLVRDGETVIRGKPYATA